MNLQSQIELIADEIADERCILLLGPQLCTNEAGQDHETCFKTQISESGLTLDYDADRFLRFQDSQNKRLYIRRFKNYFLNSELPLPNHYLQLVQMPFHLIFYASPDLLLRRAFSKQGIPYRFAYYDKGAAPAEVEKPQQNQPLLYNLFGNIEEDDSLLITQHDLFDFIFAILDDKKLPREIKNAIRRAKMFVFLGFDLERWYMRLILRLFELHQPDILTYLSQAEQETQAFYIDQFDAQFLDLGSLALIKKLHQQFQQKGQLREVQERGENPIIRKLHELTERNQARAALQTLKSFYKAQSNDEAEDQYSRILLHSARLQDLEDKQSDGELTPQEFQAEFNRINKAVLRSVRSLKTYLDERPQS